MGFDISILVVLIGEPMNGTAVQLKEQQGVLMSPE